MGDRFYLAQGRTITGEREGKYVEKPKRKLKADWLKDINDELGATVPGLDKCTIDTLTALLKAIKNHNQPENEDVETI